MNDPRLIEDHLRAEYVALLPAMQRTLIALETEINYLLLPIKLDLHRYERLLVRSRTKESESAVDALRRRQEAGIFDPAQGDHYSLTALPDLVAVRVLAFPPRRLEDIHRILTPRLATLTFDPIPAAGPTEQPILKYHGFWNRGDRVKAEIQIVPLLIGLFWEVEHSAIYKPSPELRGAAKLDVVRERTIAVHRALREFQEVIEAEIEESS